MSVGIHYAWTFRFPVSLSMNKMGDATIDLFKSTRFMRHTRLQFFCPVYTYNNKITQSI